MPCSSQPNREFARAPTRIFVWRQSLRMGARADGTDRYGKSESLRSARGGPDRRRAPSAQRGRAGVPGVRRRGRLEGRVHRGRGTGMALSLLRQEVHLPHRHRPRALPEAAPPSGSPSSDSCATTSPSSARPSRAASPTRPPSSGGTACSPRYPATLTGTSTSSGSTRRDGWDPTARVVRHILIADVTDATCRSLR